MKKISILIPTFNEEENIVELCARIHAIMEKKTDYDYELVIIDNASTDKTVEMVKKEIEKNKHVKLIVNARNFGQVRSPFHGILQCKGDAIVLMAADLQEQPELISDFIQKWEEGYKIVLGIKNKSKENPIMFALRKLYYNILSKFSETDQIKNFTGFGLYDRSFIEVLRTIEEPYPFFRGLVGELGYDKTEVHYTQEKRKKGKTKNNFYTLYDIGMLGFVNHSKLPLRLASFLGFGIAILSLVAAAVFFILKLFFWYQFTLGTAPLIIGLFFFSSVQLFFIGIIGEYIGSIHTQVKKRPLVIEKERVNFESV